MPRRVIEGTPGNLTVVRLAQLPFNFDHSYFRYVRFLGRSNAARSARYLDVVDSEVAADLTNVDMTGVESFHSDWRGATMTEAQVEDLCNYDITRGYMWQESKDYLDANTTLGQAAKDAILEAFPPENDRRSGKRMLARWMSVTGMTLAEVLTHYAALYGAHPRIMENFHRRRENDDVVQPPAISVAKSGGRVRVPVSEWPQALRDIAREHDRWKLARGCEQLLNARFPAEAPFICYWKKLWPVWESEAQPRSWLMESVLAGEVLGEYGIP